MKMTFEGKLAICFENFSFIDKPEYTKNQINLYADFIELMTLYANSDGVTHGDINDRFFGTKDYSINLNTSSEQRDKDERFIDELLELIKERIKLYKDEYPFVYDKSEILLLKENIKWKQKLYIGLLISSKLNIFNQFQSNLTTEFEIISYEVFKKLLPESARIKEFGKNSSYTGNARKKINCLAKDIGLSVDDYELSCVDERNYQERGLDIIGWIPFDDKCQNILVYLAQCACGKDTESKHHDTRRFENYLKFYKTSPQHLMFIPYSLMNTRENKFYHSDLIEKDFLILERKRIISLFKEEDIFNQLKINKIVNGCIEYKQDIV